MTMTKRKNVVLDLDNHRSLCFNKTSCFSLLYSSHDEKKVLMQLFLVLEKF